MTVDINIDPSLGLKQAILMELLEIWRGQCNGEVMPPWPDFDVLQIPAAMLPRLYLIDGLENNPPRPRWRLLGTHTTEVLERDNTGKYFDEIYSPKDTQDMSVPVLWVREQKAPLRLDGQTQFADKDWIHYECIYLPYAGESGDVAMVLGGIVYENGPI
ncbi:MAG: PAS domain-containing protein [Rhodospirillaceae bacterium]|jgi:hypothetical protein|nr:PAS domain-containing protein [Rhodospirillaceae bacterium]MBT3492034.1 PAS domain-containing protein [Rhodospirillaceae bacterium]MBT3781392.1 PAS domain-containing protein [Rhodospirillaceae bacterium]MBT3974978.1 PAS domain-containing protein [Rhodospirillaceae bacterium]MBT4169335.1 PAS domain-containing protein [Rhodospirillaceae bacterium]